MKTEFLTKGFTHTESMDQFLQETTLEAVNDYLIHDKDIHFRVIVDEDRHRNQSRKPHFVCEIQFKCASSKRYLKVHKVSGDFREAVIEASHAMRKLLQKRSSRYHDHGRDALKAPLKPSPGESDTTAA
jgi:ribosome-associated translation inhibitor RaiA